MGVPGGDVPVAGPPVEDQKMSAPRIRTALIGLVLLLAAPATVGASGASTMTREERIAFLQNARIVSSHDVGKGITRPVRVTLSDGTTTHDAGFSTVDDHEAVMHFQSGRTELDFVDSYKFSVAAYNLAVLIGLDDMMPVTVEREFKHHKGSLVWWVDDVKYDEGDRLKLKLSAPDPEAWNRQMFRMRLFTQLVADEDRNTGNVLITSDWKLWMIDFTRAFRRNRQLLAPGDVTRCDRQVLERLKTLTKEQVAAATKPYIGGGEVDALLARRDAIVALIEKQVAARGEAQVLY